MSRSPNFKFRSFAPAAPAHIAARDPFKLERRCEPRYADEGSLSASYSSAPDAPPAFGITHLQVVDPRGLGATSRTPIRPGSRVTICPEGSTIPWLAATAVRCEPCEEGFRIGLKYSGAAAAA
jgi:hypothetical protein